MLIRYATRKDAQDIARIHVEAWRSGYKGIMPDEYLKSLSVKEKTRQWDEALATKGPGINRVVVLNGVISGFCVYGPARDDDLSNENAGELVALNISPDCWGQGLGTELAKQTVKSAHHYQWRSLYLWVLKENTRARRLYEQMGFSRQGREKFTTQLTGHELHEIRYVRQIPADSY
ncbi:hypothetical protein MNBD_GAMMA20-465 [hydrothermal vent metagenome]|uniref:N-acetyltransferase domain-containing protein n=1 Tax=hydrothermal vent metagenome TaxID=652676 RepID=A0A3B1AQ60_9ZZZZ